MTGSPTALSKVREPSTFAMIPLGFMGVGGLL
jgi:hypothetical protein